MTPTSHIAPSDLRSRNALPLGQSTALATPSLVADLSRLAAVWQKVTQFIAPLGYQDALGFHYGEVPNPNGTISAARKWN